MSLLKSVAPPLAIIGTVCAVLASSAPAEAYEYREGTIDGYRAEILDSGSYDALDLIYVWGPNGKEEIFVQCSPYRWESTGPNTQSFVEQVTQSWCF